jgi:Domain of unknown function (DUF1707)
MGPGSYGTSARALQGVDTPRAVGHTVAVGGKLVVRLSNAERQVVVERLRDGFADGRLTLDELHERLDRAYGATTRGDVVPLTADLPRPKVTRRRDTRRLRVPWTFLEVNAILWGIWGAQELFATSGTTTPWPLIVTLPWGALIVVARAKPRKQALPR